MANRNKYLHFTLHRRGETEEYRSPRQGGERLEILERNRLQHARNLRHQINEVQDNADIAKQAHQDARMEEGISVEFESFPDIKRAFENLAREHWGIELLNIRLDNNITYATVFVPDGKLNCFERLVHNYLIEKRDKNGKRIDNRKLIDTIRRIRVASLRSLWTDAAEIFPTVEEEPFWWEVWLPIRGNQEATAEAFCKRAKTLGMQVAQGSLKFPERTVLLVRAALEQMQSSMAILNNIAELRRSKETAEFFDSMSIDDQHAWLDDLMQRIRYPSVEENMPYVCLLDTGVNRGHPLLNPVLTIDDLYTVDPMWGINDTHGHGTRMAGLALTGNLTEILEGSDLVQVNHRLESVKLLPHDGATGIDPRHHGYLTMEAVARPEISAPTRHRVFGMTITAQENRDEGKPSAWSAALDSLAADVGGCGANRRLLVVSAGNVKDINACVDYPHNNDTDEIHDPAQAWNALTVGAFTSLGRIDLADSSRYRPIAPVGGLSPFSTTSLMWEPHWPLKPDVVFEGGNAAQDSLGAVEMSSLRLLTTHHELADRFFTTANATSAATALASRFAAQIMAVYPDFWPETIRALIVHSAEWTDAMQRTFMPTHEGRNKKDYLNLLRRCGFGVPHLGRALWSVENSLTMIIEDNLHPFKEGTGSEAVFRDMHFHHLPWPIDVLEELGETEVEMRVTLSYFIEPNPSQRGVNSRYRYGSHGLRFDVKRPLETPGRFRRRVNAAAEAEDNGSSQTDYDSPWLIGVQGRHKGSIHGDIWQGTAADLASQGVIAVYPAAGWWKTRIKLERFDQSARYSLVVGIKAPEVEVDLYAPVANQIAAEVEVEI